MHAGSDSTHDATRVVLTIPSEVRYLRWARSAVESAVRSLGASAELAAPDGVTLDALIPDALLVVSELVTNAIVHGDGERVRLEVSAANGELALRLSNRGTSGSFAPVERWELPLPTAESGRGLGIVRSLCHSVGVSDHDGWVTVECRFPARRPT